MTRSGALLRWFARVLRTPMRLSGETHATALGAALLAAVGQGTHADLRSATAAMVRDRPLDPLDQHAGAFDEYYAQWLETYDRLKAQSV
jgi:L-ribulokinase